MSTAFLEHANVTVTDPDDSARLLCTLFDWKVRWSGDSTLGGRTVHVGSDSNYVALYTQDSVAAPSDDSYATRSALNHLGIVVDDLDLAEKRVLAAGLTPHNHQDYEPGRRFYFDTPDGIEIEVVSYQSR